MGKMAQKGIRSSRSNFGRSKVSVPKSVQILTEARTYTHSLCIYVAHDGVPGTRVQDFAVGSLHREDPPTAAEKRRQRSALVFASYGTYALNNRRRSAIQHGRCKLKDKIAQKRENHCG